MGDVVPVPAGQSDSQRGAVPVGDQMVLAAWPRAVDRRSPGVRPFERSDVRAVSRRIVDDQPAPGGVSGGRRSVEGLGNGVFGGGPCQDSQGRLTMRTVYAEETQRLVPTLRKPLVVDADARIVEPSA